jgi:hypothetical protein
MDTRLRDSLDDKYTLGADFALVNRRQGWYASRSSSGNSLFAAL